eukprot:5992593-Amphidinium_carterae.2
MRSYREVSKHRACQHRHKLQSGKDGKLILCLVATQPTGALRRPVARAEQVEAAHLRAVEHWGDWLYRCLSHAPSALQTLR